MLCDYKQKMITRVRKSKPEGPENPGIPGFPSFRKTQGAEIPTFRKNSEFQTPSFRVSGKSERFRVVVRVSLEFRDSAKIPSFSKEEPKNSEIQDGKFRDSGKIPSFSPKEIPSFRRNGVNASRHERSGCRILGDGRAVRTL